MYLNVYVPKLQRKQGVVGLLRQHRGQPLPSAALMSPISRAFVSELEGFAANNEIPLVRFRKGERKDDQGNRVKKWWISSEGGSDNG
jgi:hypothetical protein